MKRVYFLTIALFIGVVLQAQPLLKLNNGSLFARDTLRSNGNQIKMLLTIENVGDAAYELNGFRIFCKNLKDGIGARVKLDSIYVVSLGAGASVEKFVTYTVDSGSFSLEKQGQLAVWIEGTDTRLDSVVDSCYFQEMIGGEPIFDMQTKTKLDSLVFGDTLNFTVPITNVGNVDLAEDSLFINSMVNGNPASIQSFKLLNASLVAFGKNQILFEPEIVVNSSYFKTGGGNVIIVWPVGFKVLANDTLKVDATVLGLQDVAEANVVIYPVPVKDRFFIRLPDNLKIESVRITDVLGRAIEVSNKPDSTKPYQLEKGYYVVEILLENGQRASSRIIVQ